MLTGSFIPTSTATFGDVAGYPIPGQEVYSYGGGLKKKKRKRLDPSVRYTHPGYNDGTDHHNGFRRVKQKTEYSEFTPDAQAQVRDFTFRDRDLLVNPHIGLKRALDRDKAASRKQEAPEPMVPMVDVPDAELEDYDPATEELAASEYKEADFGKEAEIPPHEADIPREQADVIETAITGEEPPEEPQMTGDVRQDPETEEPQMTGDFRHVAGPRQPPPPPPIDWAFEEPQTAGPVVLPVKAGVGEKRPAEDVEGLAADEPPTMQPDVDVAAEVPPSMDVTDEPPPSMDVTDEPPPSMDVAEEPPSMDVADEPPPSMDVADIAVVADVADEPPKHAPILPPTGPVTVQSILPVAPVGRATESKATETAITGEEPPKAKPKPPPIHWAFEKPVEPPPYSSLFKPPTSDEKQEPEESVKRSAEDVEQSLSPTAKRQDIPTVRLPPQPEEKEFVTPGQQRRRRTSIPSVIDRMKNLGFNIPEILPFPRPKPPLPPSPKPVKPPPPGFPYGWHGHVPPIKPPKKPPLPPISKPWVYVPPLKPKPKPKPDPKPTYPYGWHGYQSPTKAPKKPPLPPPDKPPAKPWKKPKKPLPWVWVSPLKDPKKPPLPRPDTLPYGWHGYVPPRKRQRQPPLPPPAKPPAKPWKKPKKPLPPIGRPWVYVPPIKPRPKPKPKPPRPALHRKTDKSFEPVPSRPALHRITTASSQPVPDKPKKVRARSPKVIYREGRGRGGPGGGDMKVAPVQQVTVAPAQTAGAAQSGRDNSELLKKIDELLKSQKDSKRKKEGNKAFNAAKKQYRDYRKKQLATMNKQNKEIKKRELAKIRRMPAGVRAKMRKQLAEKLKQRADNIKKRLPSKITSTAQLRDVVKGGSRTLVV